MQERRRTPRGSAMDGFVRRKPTHRRRASLDSTPGSRKRAVFDDFVPRHEDAHEPIQVDPRNAASIPPNDEDVITLDSEDLDVTAQTVAGKEGGRRRRSRKNSVHDPNRKKKIIKRIALGVLIIGLIVGGFLGWKVYKNTSKIFNGNVLGFLESTKLRGEESGRVNFILAGTSEDDGPAHGGADLTDSIMLASIDTKNNTGFTMSIPRDLWVSYGEACSSGYQGKINVAYQCGEDVNFKEAGYAEGGMGLLQKIVSENFGIPIHYYGKISYTAFKDAVNAVGGIEVEVASDDPRGIYDPNFQKHEGGPLKLSNGKQTLDGQTALRLARSRNSAGGYGMARGDFDRTTYQQAMLLALKDKALSAGVISNPAKLGELLDAAGDNVSTNLQASEVRRLHELSKLIQSSNVTTVDLASEEVALLTTGSQNGQSIVRPVAGLTDFSDIKSYLKKLTSSDPMVREDATIVVLNGSGVVGLAQKRADTLTDRGLAISGIGNASERADSIIIDTSQGSKKSTKSFLEKEFNTVSTTDVAAVPEASRYQADFIIVLGTKLSNNVQN